MLTPKEAITEKEKSIGNKVAILEKSRMILGKDQQMNEVIDKELFEAIEGLQIKKQQIF